MASRRRGKGRRKVGRKSAGCAAGSDIARSDASLIVPQLVKPPHSDSSLVLLDIDGGTRAIRRNDSRSPEGKDSHNAERRSPCAISR